MTDVRIEQVQMVDFSTRGFDPTKVQRLKLSDRNVDVENGFVYWVYRGITTNNPNGTLLVDFPSSQRVRVFVGPKISWQPNALDENKVFTSPTPGGNFPGAFRFQNAQGYSVVLFQENGKVATIPYVQPAPYFIEVVAGLPIYVTVNDLIAPGEYENNAGSFDIFIAQIFP